MILFYTKYHFWFNISISLAIALIMEFLYQNGEYRYDGGLTL